MGNEEWDLALCERVLYKQFARLESHVPVWVGYIRTLTSDFVFVFLADVLLASAMIYTCTTFFSFSFFPEVFFHSRVTGEPVL